MEEDEGERRRSLVLTGGLQDAAFQAGVLQVWLDEVGLSFDHVDGSGGGCLNAAMWAQGMDGTAIAESWRALDPVALDFAWADSADPLRADSLFTLERWRRHALPGWDLDWRAIRSSGRAATFRVYDLARREPVILGVDEIDDELLHASISSPGWLPPVVIGSRTWADASFVVGGCFDEALRRGADEVWVVAPTRVRGDEAPTGVVTSWARLGEISLVGRLQDAIARVERSNASLASGEPSELDRRVETRLLEIGTGSGFEGALDRNRLAEVVNRGVEAARFWCLENDVGLRTVGRTHPTEIPEDHTTVRYREVLRGRLAEGGNGTPEGSGGQELVCRLRILVDGIDRLGETGELVGEVSGEIVSDDLDGSRSIEKGTITFHEGERGRGVVYRLRVTDSDGRERVLLGVRPLSETGGEDPLGPASVDARLLESEASTTEGEAGVVAEGRLVIQPLDRLRQILTMRATGPSREAREEGLDAFGRYLHGDTWAACVGRLRDRPRRRADTGPPEERVRT